MKILITSCKQTQAKIQKRFTNTWLNVLNLSDITYRKQPSGPEQYTRKIL